jgi:uncharacterized protein YndB with AHSA1/START domain
MKSTTKILSVVGALTLVIVILPVFLSPNFSMARSIEIQAPIGSVFSKLTNLNVYSKWNPFPEGDLTNQVNVTGEGVGSALAWTGEKTGDGKMTITHIEEGKKITVKMEFYKPMSGEGTVQWITNSKSDTNTEVIWTFEQNLSYFNRYFGLFMDAMMGKHFEKGLLNFKTLAEASN